MLFKRNSFLILTLLLVSGFTCTASSLDHIVVVTSQKNQLEAIDRKGLIDLFMGKYAAFPNGELATPIDIESETDLKAQFYQSLVGLPLARVNAYWSRLKFSGRVKPPAIEQSISDVQRRLAEDESALAYVYESHVTDKMKVVYRFD